jgi:transmembrane sensor
MSNLDQLSERLAALQDRQLAAHQSESSPPSTALGEHLLRRSSERKRARRVGLASAALVLIAAGALTGLRVWPSHDASTVAAVRAQAGQRVEARLLDLALAFDDGSQVVLSSGGSLRTEMLGPSSAELAIERGRAHVRVVHTAATRWTVRAGNYAIAVTGTRFGVEWRPDHGAFSVVVEEGSVRVSGGLLTQAVDIHAGQSLALENGHPIGAAMPAGTAPAATPSPAAPATASPDREPAIAPAAPSDSFVTTPSHRPAVHRSPTPTLSWREQAEAGRYREALAEVERKGFDGVCREAPGADLLTLAEAARYGGRADRAEQALKAVRGRFGQGEDSAMAAYLLGRIAAENRHDHADAARWFRTYLVERPGGRLNREAEGRLLESLAFMDRNTAREAARAYLAHYPTGPHAAFARNLLGL